MTRSQLVKMTKQQLVRQVELDKVKNIQLMRESRNDTHNYFASMTCNTCAKYQDGFCNDSFWCNNNVVDDVFKVYEDFGCNNWVEQK